MSFVPNFFEARGDDDDGFDAGINAILGGFPHTGGRNRDDAQIHFPSIFTQALETLEAKDFSPFEVHGDDLAFEPAFLEVGHQGMPHFSGVMRRPQDSDGFGLEEFF